MSQTQATRNGEAEKAHQREVISLLGSLNGEWIKLPLKIMQDVGPAVQTLGGLLKITNRETFVSAGKLAQRARLPVATVRKQLDTLHDHGLIDNVGRGHTRAGRARRTCTIKVTEQTKASLSDYAILPWWACCHVAGAGRLPWSAKALLSLLMSRLAVLRFAAQDSKGLPGDEDFWETVDVDRFRFSLDRLERETGLHRETIVTAKRRLATLKIIEWFRGDDADLLVPNRAFRVLVTSAGEDRCRLAFKEGSESGQ